MKLLGGALLLTAASLLGCCAAGKYTADAVRIRLLRQWLSAVMSALRCALPLISSLLRETALMPQFASLFFLQRAAGQAAAFPACWEEALAADKSLSSAERGVLETVGQTLGSTDLAGQLAALELCDERLAAMQTEAESRAKQKGGLCRSMGILGGLFLVIILL